MPCAATVGALPLRACLALSICATLCLVPECQISEDKRDTLEFGVLCTALKCRVDLAAPQGRVAAKFSEAVKIAEGCSTCGDERVPTEQLAQIDLWRRVEPARTDLDWRKRSVPVKLRSIGHLGPRCNACQAALRLALLR